MMYAFVTGASRGIGRQIALDFLKRGCFVIANYRDSEQDMLEAQDAFSKISDKFTFIKADMSRYEDVMAICEKLSSTYEGVDYLILNCGATSRVPFGHITQDEWQTVFNANVSMPLFLIQGLRDKIRHDGRIVFIGSILGIVPHSVSIPYGVSKASQHMLVKYLVSHFSPQRITVNAIAPGFVDTSWHTSKSPELIASISSKISLGRFADVSEISNACMFLIDNSYVTGQVVVVDGGYCFT